MMMEANEAQTERLLTTAEVAEICRTTASTVRYWRHTGYGPPGFRAGRKVLYRSTEVSAWLRNKAAQERTR